MRKSLKCLVLPFALVLGGAAMNPLSAQLFTDPVADNFVYNNVKLQSPTVTSNYSRDLQNGTTLYLSSWGTHTPGGESEFIYFFSNTGFPALPISQGTFTYKDVSDIEVGLYWDINTNGYVVPVAYYQNGVGHMVDLYQLMGSSLVQTGSIPLSSASTYGRIRMDSHNGYGIIIVWENPGIGIEAIGSENGVWGAIQQLAGTNMETSPDVAFSHTASGSATLNVRLVYKNPINQTITEAIIDWPTLSSPAPNNPVPMVEDVIFTPLPVSNLSLDCPDHYHSENWAYAFTDGEQVYVRYVDQMSMGSPQTRILNDGSLGNVPTFNGNNTAHSPTLHYGDSEYSVGGYTGQIKVGWYNVDNAASGPFAGNGRYIGIKMRENGGALMSDPDYMGISLNTMPVLANFHSGISFSKMGEGHWGSAPPFMYTTYFEEANPGNGDYQLHHAFHRWDNPRFRGSEPPVTDAASHIECSPNMARSQAEVMELNVSPNPFMATLNNKVTMRESGTLVFTLTDISGRQVAQKEVQLNKGRHMVEMKDLEQLLPGTYFLNSTVNGKGTGARTVIKL